MKKSILMSLLLSLLSCTAKNDSHSSTQVASGKLEPNTYSLSIRVRAEQAFKAYWDDTADTVLNSDANNIINLKKTWPLVDREKSFQFTSALDGASAISGRLGIQDCDFISGLSYAMDSFNSIELAYNFYPDYNDPPTETHRPIEPSLAASTPKLIRYTGFSSGDDPMAITCQELQKVALSPSISWGHRRVCPTS